MMVKYIMKSPSFAGNVVFGYQDEFCVFFHNESDMNAVQKQWIWDHFPRNLEALKGLVKVIKGTISLVPPNTEFDDFWDVYKKKVNRKRCEPLWEKLSESKKVEAIMAVAAYDGYLKRTGRAKLDPENYLRNESWENNWNALR